MNDNLFLLSIWLGKMIRELDEDLQFKILVIAVFAGIATWCFFASWVVILIIQIY